MNLRAAGSSPLPAPRSGAAVGGSGRGWDVKRERPSVRVVVLTALMLALASLALPLQIDAGALRAAHAPSTQAQNDADAPPSRHATGTRDRHLDAAVRHPTGAPPHAPRDGRDEGSHEHDVHCFWCVASVGILAGRTHAPRRVVGAAEERVPSAAIRVRRIVLHDAAPRAPPA